MELPPIARPTPSHPASLTSLPLPPTSTSTSLSTHYTTTPSRPLPPNDHPLPRPLAITPCDTAHLPALRRLTTLLLPIRYPDTFYTAIVTSAEDNALTRIALWDDALHGYGGDAAAGVAFPATTSTSPSLQQHQPTKKLIGAIRCRLHASFPPPSIASSPPTHHAPPTLYIQTLTLLAPYRALGVAAALLADVCATARDLYGATHVWAHVWEGNDEALGWYVRRGFVVDGGVVEGYYRRLRPGGARVVRKRL
ncbi:MAG: hypothetical protein M1833_006231 [Piccolia ochrophora]|nr:MAG: hypothetical protein M1833_006231 [Piccolia ochrophora]